MTHSIRFDLVAVVLFLFALLMLGASSALAQDAPSAECDPAFGACGTPGGGSGGGSGGGGGGGW